MTYSGGIYFYVQDHLYSTAALVDASGTPQERYEYDAYGQVHMLDANFADDADGVSDCGNPYMFTGRRVDFLDGGNLTLQINRHRYYDYYTGRWLTEDPLGIVPDPERPNIFDAPRQYAEGLSLYQYVRNNPLRYADAFGLWKVYRDLEAKAVAESEEKDTIAKLARFVGLETWEWRDWITFLDDELCLDGKGPVDVQHVGLVDELCPGEEVKIPNTVLAYWGGAFGAFGKWWVGWCEDIARLEKRGFYVPELEGLPASGLESEIETLQAANELHGIFAWGHGHRDYLKTWDLGGDAYKSYYWNWRPDYGMALGIIWACHSGDGEAERWFSYSPGAIFQGAAGLLVPWPFHAFGRWTDEIVGPGQQGTRF
jgi:RHS repeat-associated protein